jgi:hypothetical protein
MTSTSTSTSTTDAAADAALMSEYQQRRDARAVAVAFAESLAAEFTPATDDLVGGGDRWGDLAWEWRRELFDTGRERAALTAAAARSDAAAKAWTDYGNALAAALRKAPGLVRVADPSDPFEKTSVVADHIDTARIAARIERAVTDIDAIAGAYRRRYDQLSYAAYLAENALTDRHLTGPPTKTATATDGVASDTEVPQ